MITMKLKDAPQFLTFIQRVFINLRGFSEAQWTQRIEDVLETLEDLRDAGATTVSLSIDVQESITSNVRAWNDNQGAIELSLKQRVILDRFIQRAAEVYNPQQQLEPGGGWTADLYFYDEGVRVSCESYLYKRRRVFLPEKSFNF